MDVNRTFLTVVASPLFLFLALKEHDHRGPLSDLSYTALLEVEWYLVAYKLSTLAHTLNVINVCMYIIAAHLTDDVQIDSANT